MADHRPPRGSVFVNERRSRPCRAASLSFDVLDQVAVESYDFSASVWDIALFVGTDALGSVGSLHACLLLGINICMHIVFLCIAMINFRNPNYESDDALSMQQWRLGSGHDFANYDTASGASLVSRVCNRDNSLLNSAAQSEILWHLRHYLSKDGGSEDSTLWNSIFNGQVLCMVALSCFYLMLSSEIHRTLDLLRAVACLPLSRLCLLAPEETSGATKYRIISMSRCRLLISVAVASYRMCACALLLYCGSYFLVFTDDIADLILNAVALEIILNLDEMLFHALAPTPSKHLIQNLEPLKMKPWPRKLGLDVKSMIMTLVMPIFLAVSFLFLLGPTVAEFTNIVDATCQGSQDFVVAEHAQLGVVFAMNTTGWMQNFGSDVALSPIQRVVKSIINDLGEHNYISAPSAHSLHAELTLSNNNFAKKYGRCSDLDSSWPHYGTFLATLRYQVQNDELTSCSNVTRAHCIARDKPFVRFACPISCGCNNIFYGSIHVDGCPFEACLATDEYNIIRRNAHHQDVDPRVLAETGDWRLYLQSIDDEAASTLGLPANSAQLVQDTLMSNGCQGIRSLGNLSSRSQMVTNLFCNEGNGPDRRTLCPFCPETCACDATTGDYFTASRDPGTGCEDLEVRVENFAMRPCGLTNTTHQYPSPDGLYVCSRDPITNRRKYNQDTQNNEKWDISYAASLSMEGHFMGAGVGMQQTSKWILASFAATQQAVARYFAMDLLDPGVDSVSLFGWLPRNAINSDADCAAGVPRLRVVPGIWLLGDPGESSCVTVCNARNMQCRERSMLAHASELQNVSIQRTLLEDVLPERMPQIYPQDSELEGFDKSWQPCVVSDQADPGRVDVYKMRPGFVKCIAAQGDQDASQPQPLQPTPPAPPSAPPKPPQKEVRRLCYCLGM
eukprot:TRINITY_DN9529_c0_g1_i1.p1 TRINITY_DN9529_c0_g1~~TRINITY_DN9529_c0_g1_i1.p1  ORF type:complete len:1019 (+),score=109.00 TRINITY_DN9529_c0_g1_i1:349-3057(+)